MVDATNLLRETIEAVEPRRDQLIDHFYGRLFGRAPELQFLFANSSDPGQRRKLWLALTTIVETVDEPGRRTPYLQYLGQHHAAHGVQPADFEAFCEVMLESLAHVVGESWTDAHASAWGEALRSVGEVMVDAGQPLRDADLSAVHRP